ncbi:hypothetical protein JCM18237_07980 [Halorubrum luteum]
MAGSTPQRLTDVGVRRALVYGLLVGAAAYLIATAYGPQGVYTRVGIATVLAGAYVAIVHAVGVRRADRRVQRR